ncbi:MAG: heme ABC transporter permease [Hyphomonadaceae bacterium]
MLTAFANPLAFMRFSAWAAPALWIVALVLLAVGLPWGLALSPADYQQGETVRIMYVHVPAAWWALGIYAFMAGASVIGLVWRHALADVAARCAAPIGASYAALCLMTGSLWGQPTWGTWWAWDVRLTSMLILFVIYLGYIALWQAIEDEEKAGRLAAILCLVGLLNLPIIHFAVEWRGALHQAPSVIRTGGASIHPEMLGPLLAMAFAYLALFGALLLTNMRAAVNRRRVEAARERGQA